MKSNVDKISTFLFEAHEAGSKFVNLEKDMKPKDFNEILENRNIYRCLRNVL